MKDLLIFWMVLGPVAGTIAGLFVSLKLDEGPRRPASALAVASAVTGLLVAVALPLVLLAGLGWGGYKAIVGSRYWVGEAHGYLAARRGRALPRARVVRGESGEGR